MAEEFSPMRRKDRLMSQADAEACLARGEIGLLSTVSEAGRPCGVPVSYVVVNGRIYFHSAKDGEKVRNMRREPRVSFCTAVQDRPLYNGQFTVLYESAVAHGRAVEVTNEEEKARALRALCEKYFPDMERDTIVKGVEGGMAATAVFCIDIEHLAGKSNTEEAK